MYLRWDGDRALADREMIAHLYEVSVRTVRRHCEPVDTESRTTPRGRRGGGGRALYDAFAVAEVLKDVAPRPGRAVAELRRRQAQTQNRLVSYR